MFFTQEQIAEMANKFGSMSERCQDLVKCFMVRKYTNKQAREYATHGFSRRLFTLVECMEIIFDRLPPERDRIPTRKERLDATIGIQAFVFNAFGSIDNLAWIWVLEKGVKNKKGEPIHKNAIGLASHHMAVRASLSPVFQEYLTGKDDWFKQLEDFRHALAHRVPLFVPPYIITKDKEAAYNELEAAMNEALSKRDYDEYDKKAAAQKELGIFRPVMLHSVVESEAYVAFHPQFLADFATIEELAGKMLEELDR
jgi:hypothetical protein